MLYRRPISFLSQLLIASYLLSAGWYFGLYMAGYHLLWWQVVFMVWAILRGLYLLHNLYEDSNA